VVIQRVKQNLVESAAAKPRSLVPAIDEASPNPVCNVRVAEDYNLHHEKFAGERLRHQGPAFSDGPRRRFSRMPVIGQAAATFAKSREASGDDRPQRAPPMRPSRIARYPSR